MAASFSCLKPARTSALPIPLRCQPGLTASGPSKAALPLPSAKPQCVKMACPASCDPIIPTRESALSESRKRSRTRGRRSSSGNACAYKTSIAAASAGTLMRNSSSSSIVRVYLVPDLCSLVIVVQENGSGSFLVAFCCEFPLTARSGDSSIGPDAGFRARIFPLWQHRQKALHRAFPGPTGVAPYRRSRPRKYGCRR